MVQLIKSDRSVFLVPCFALRAACLIAARSKDQVFNLKWDQLSIKKNKNGKVVIGDKIKYTDTKNDDALAVY